MKRLLLALLAILAFLMPLHASQEDPVVALVLSGGGARGFAHVPIIEELEERGIRPDLVIGVSMGGLIGGLYASGYTVDEIYSYIRSADLMNTVFQPSQEGQQEIGKAVNPWWDRSFSLGFSDEGIGGSGSFLSDHAINHLLHDAFCRTEDIGDFDELPIPFRTLGTDFSTGGPIVYSQGNLYEALRATMSMPVIFPPLVMDDGTYVVDGGVWDNLPVDLARELGADIVIAVDVNESTIAAGMGPGVDTLSGAFLQYLLVIGQKSIIGQYPLSDYLLTPGTGSSSVMGYDDVEGIFEATRTWIDENDALFDQIEEALSPYMDDDSITHYTDIPYSTIEGFVFDEETGRFASHFDSFIGHEWDEDVIARIDHDLAMVKAVTNLKSVDYKLVDGVVHVRGMESEGLSGSVHLGLRGGVFTTFDLSDGDFRFQLDPDFSLSFDFWLDDVKLTPAMKLGQENRLSFEAGRMFGSGWGLWANAHGGFGGYSASSGREAVDRLVTRDWNFGFELGSSFLIGLSHRIDIVFSYDYYLLDDIAGSDVFGIPGQQLWDQKHHHLPRLSLGYHFDLTRLEEVLWGSLDFRAGASVGWDEGWGWDLWADMRSHYMLSGGALEVDLSLFSSRMPYEILSSWRIDPFGQVTQDLVFFELGWRHYFISPSNGFYGMLGFFLEGLGRDRLGPVEPPAAPVPFSTIDGLEGGISIALGTSFLTATLRISLTGRMSFVASFV